MENNQYRDRLKEVAEEFFVLLTQHSLFKMNLSTESIICKIAYLILQDRELCDASQQLAGKTPKEESESESVPTLGENDATIAVKKETVDNEEEATVSSDHCYIANGKRKSNEQEGIARKIIRRSADESKQFSCCLCGRLFSRCIDARKHVGSVHKENPDDYVEKIGDGRSTVKNSNCRNDYKKYRCTICQQTLAEKRNARQHVKKLHSIIRNVKNYIKEVNATDLENIEDNETNILHDAGKEENYIREVNACDVENFGVNETNDVKQPQDSDFETTNAVERDESESVEDEASEVNETNILHNVVDSQDTHSKFRKPNNDKKHQCTVCQKILIRFSDAKRHVRSVHGICVHEKHYIQEVKVEDSQDIRSKYRKFNQDKKQQCTICQRILTRFHDAKRHVQKVHRIIGEEEHYIKEVDAADLGNIEVNETNILHNAEDLQDTHSNHPKRRRDKKHQCALCQKILGQFHEAKRHVRTVHCICVEEKQYIKEVNASDVENSIVNETNLVKQPQDSDFETTNAAERNESESVEDEALEVNETNILHNVEDTHSKFRKSHHDKRRQCTICQKILNRFSSAKRHVRKLHRIIGEEENYVKEVDATDLGNIEVSETNILHNVEDSQDTHPKYCKSHKRHQCTICQKIFQFHNAKRHVRSVHRITGKEEHYIKEINTSDFQYLEAMKRWQCTICGNVFAGISYAKRHVRLLHSLTSERSHLKKLTHEESSKFQDACIKPNSFQSSEEFATKQYIFSIKPTRYNCKLCNRVFFLKVEACNHVRNVHKKKSPSLYVKQPTNTVTAMSKVRRILTARGIGIPPVHRVMRLRGRRKVIGKGAVNPNDKRVALSETIPCFLCDQVLENENDFKRHMKSHEADIPVCDCLDEDSHSCVVCGERFKTKQAAIEHIGNHFPRKPFSCVVCERDFLHKDAAERHEQKHQEVIGTSGDDEYFVAVGPSATMFSPKVAALFLKCNEAPREECGTLKKDSRTRSVNIFPCYECGRVFFAQKILQKHLFTRHHSNETERNYKCHLCKIQFANIVSAEKHVHLMHKVDKKEASNFYSEILPDTEFQIPESESKPKKVFFHCYCGFQFDGLDDLALHMLKCEAAQDSATNFNDEALSAEMKENCFLCCTDKSSLNVFTLCGSCTLKCDSVAGVSCPVCNEQSGFKGMENHLHCYKQKETEHLGENAKERKPKPKEKGGIKKCGFCGVWLPSRHDLAKHYKIVHMGQPRQTSTLCQICNKALRGDQIIWNHLLEHKGLVCNVTCNFCDAPYTSPESLSEHMREEHSDPNFPYSCLLCDARYASRSELITHFNFHPDKTIHSCEKCPRKFYLAVDLKEHCLRSHEKKTTKNKGPYNCEFCEKVYPSYSGFVYHMLCHKGVKPFQCEFCGNEFKTNSELKVHRRKHTLEKPYQCTTCGAQFSRRGTLVHHTAVHTGEKRYVCQICNSRFKTRKTLVRHERLCNGMTENPCATDSAHKESDPSLSTSLLQQCFSNLEPSFHAGAVITTYSENAPWSVVITPVVQKVE